MIVWSSKPETCASRLQCSFVVDGHIYATEKFSACLVIPSLFQKWNVYESISLEKKQKNKTGSSLWMQVVFFIHSNWECVGKALKRLRKGIMP